MEAMMKSQTLCQGDHQLDPLAGQFEQWRQTRSHPSERLPQSLWDQAVALARVLPHTRVAQHLRLSSNDLKKRLAAQSEATPAPPSTPLGVVEVPPAPARSPLPSATEIELERPDGARLRLVCPETPLPLAAVVRAFLEVSGWCNSPRKAASF
jgi:hypothetical protein